MSDRVADGFGDMLRSVVLFLPKALAFVVVLVLGWLVARAVRAIVDKVLERVGFDRVVERGGVRAALARSGYDASDVVAKLAYYAVLLVALQLAFGLWGPNPVSALITAVVAWLPRAFVAIVIMVVAAAIAHGTRDLISAALGGLSYGRLLAGTASAFIIGLGAVAALNQIGVATSVTTPVLIAVLATIAGVIIVGVGGGLVRPMQIRWDEWLDRAEDEVQVLAEQRQAYDAGRRDADTGVPGAADSAMPPADPTVPLGDATVPLSDDTVPLGRRASDDDTIVVADLGRSGAPGGPGSRRAAGVADDATMVIPADATRRTR